MALDKDYSGLNHNFYFVALSHFYQKGRFHIKEPLLCCTDSKLFIKCHQRGYAEIIIDLQTTEAYGSLWIAYYIPGEYWQASMDANEFDLCKKCAKNIMEYVQKELSVPKGEKIKLIKPNKDMIHEAIREWPN